MVLNCVFKDFQYRPPYVHVHVAVWIQIEHNPAMVQNESVVWLKALVLPLNRVQFLSTTNAALVVIPTKAELFSVRYIEYAHGHGFIVWTPPLCHNTLQHVTSGSIIQVMLFVSLCVYLW